LSDLLIVNSDGLCSPTIKLNFPVEGKHRGGFPFGWGFGWYPNDNQAAIVTKDPVAHRKSILTDAIVDWSNFRSTVFVCKVQSPSTDHTHHDTQPFSRSYAGRDWLFVHRGHLDKSQLNRLKVQKSRLLEPLGKTDSEAAFCYLLSMVRQSDARFLADVSPVDLLKWFQKFDKFGEADMCFTDGLSVVCYRGTQSCQDVFFTRIQPPHVVSQFDSPSLSLGFDDGRDCFRTVLVFSSVAFGEGDWQSMKPGQLVVAKRGAIVWDNMAAKKRVVVKSSAKKAVAVKSVKKSRSGDRELTINPRSVVETASGEALSFRLFDITHTTCYRYSKAVEHSTHIFRLFPVDDLVQEVVSTQVKISSEGEDIFFEDVFGNQCVHYCIDSPYKQLSISAISRVKLYALPPDDHNLSRRQSSIPLVWMPWQLQMMMPYLLPPELPVTQLDELTDYAMSWLVVVFWGCRLCIPILGHFCRLGIRRWVRRPW